MDEIVNPVEGNYPGTLLDYTPVKLEYAENNGIDLQLSGYTHQGKGWPGNIITNLIYEISWGYKKKGKTHYYITAVAGTWGLPVRTGSKSEIVNIKINFSN